MTVKRNFIGGCFSYAYDLCMTRKIVHILMNDRKKGSSLDFINAPLIKRNCIVTLHFSRESEEDYLCCQESAIHKRLFCEIP